MREPASSERIRALARELGRVAPPGTRMYLTGGATAVLEGWRASTVDIDVRFEPEDDGILKRSPFRFREGNLDVHHFDPYSQALSKAERGFELDLEDVEAMVDRGLVEPARAIELYRSIESQLYRYPAIDPGSLRAAVGRAFAGR